MKKISACCLLPDGSKLFLGTEGGNIYQLGIHNFKLLDDIIYQDFVMQKVPNDFKVNLKLIQLKRCISESSKCLTQRIS